MATKVTLWYFAKLWLYNRIKLNFLFFSWAQCLIESRRLIWFWKLFFYLAANHHVYKCYFMLFCKILTLWHGKIWITVFFLAMYLLQCLTESKRMLRFWTFFFLFGSQLSCLQKLYYANLQNSDFKTGFQAFL